MPLLKPLKEADRNKLAARLGVLDFGGGEPIVKQGEEGDGLYFLESGKANAYRNRQRLMAYESGDYFGELALLTHAPRSATVRAVGSARCLKLDYDVFNEFAVHCGPILAQRAEMYAEQQKAQHAAEVHFEEAKIAAAVDAGGVMHYRALKPAIIRVGVGTDSPRVAGLGGKLHEGDVFKALETKQIDGGRMRIRMARGWVSVTSTSGLPLCVGEAAVQGFLKSVPLLKPLLELQRAAIARQLELMDIADAAMVVVEGEVGHAMYFVESGVLQVEKDGVIVMEYARGDWFGELALLSDAPRSATVRAKGDARCLKLEKARPFQGRGPHSRLYCSALPTQPARGFGVRGCAAAEEKSLAQAVFAKFKADCDTQELEQRAAVPAPPARLLRRTTVTRPRRRAAI